jgi:hypothetical protein
MMKEEDYDKEEKLSYNSYIGIGTTSYDIYINVYKEKDFAKITFVNFQAWTYNDIKEKLQKDQEYTQNPMIFKELKIRIISYRAAARAM